MAPPNIPSIIYDVTAEVSLGKRLLADVIPAVAVVAHAPAISLSLPARW